MIKECQWCDYCHIEAVKVEEGNEMKKEWKCDKGHEIKNPCDPIDCLDFKEKPSFRKRTYSPY
jgi:hypothetical protein